MTDQAVADITDELSQGEEEELHNSIGGDIDDLQNHGVGAADIQKLKAAGIYTLKGVMMQAKKNLVKVKGLSEAKIDKIREAAAKQCDVGFTTGTEMWLRRQQVLRITTGSKDLDQLLGGGIQTMSITEAFGEFRTGKTQLCHTLAVTTQLPVDSGGAGGRVAFIDTEGTFRPERIRAIANRFGMDEDLTLQNMIVARAYNSEHQMDLITLVAARMAEEKTFRLLIIDSIISLLRTDFIGRGELADRQQKLNQMMSRLMKLADEFNIAVLITNQMSADPGAVMSFVADPKKPVGGHVLAHASTTRLYLKKGRGETRICKVYDAPDLPEAEAIYGIEVGGITDAKE